MMGSISRTIAVTFALAAFAVAIVSGLLADVPTAQVLVRSILALFVCYLIGSAAGMACEHVVRAHVRAQTSANVGQDVDAFQSSSRSSDGDDESPIVV